MKTVRLLTALIAITNVVAVSSAKADEVSITNPSGIFINGLSYHFKDHGQQSVNLGLGVFYNLQNQVPSLVFLNEEKIALEFDAYSDSYGDFGYAGGLSWKRSLISDKMFYGLKVGLVHEDNASKNAGYFIPYIVPFLELKHGLVGVRSMLIPPLGDITDGYVTLQFLVDF